MNATRDFSKRTHFIASLAMALSLLAALPAFAAKGGKPGGGDPPPPPPPPTSCADAPGDFPAFAYTTPASYAKYHGNTVPRGSKLYLADSTGTCSLLLYTADDGPWSFAYRQVGNRGTIVWSKALSLAMLHFTVVNGAIVEGSTLAPTHPVTWPDGPPGSGGFYSYTLNHDATRLYYSFEQRAPEGSGGSWLDTLYELDIGSCSDNCQQGATKIREALDFAMGGLQSSSDDTRLFSGAIDLAAGDAQSIVMLERDANGEWPASPVPRIVISEQDDCCQPGANLQIWDAATWDHEHSGQPRDVLMFWRWLDSGLLIDVVDVADCSAAHPPSLPDSSCYEDGLVNFVTSIPDGPGGRALQFTTATPNIPFDSTTPNALAITSSQINEVDLDNPTASTTTLVDGIDRRWVDAAD